MEIIKYLECLKSWIRKDKWALDQDQCFKVQGEILIGPEVVEKKGEALEAN
jgi:hypothetical protein